MDSDRATRCCQSKTIVTSSPELSVKFDRSHRTCILDPMLALSSYGIPLVKQLGTVMDLWIGREFWHVVENIQFYLQHPELLLLNRAMPDRTEYITAFPTQEIIQSLQAWAKFRQELDLERIKLFWIGDRLNESSFPQGIPPNTIPTYERLASALANRLPPSPQTSETLSALLIDTVALSASLNSSFILTRQYATADRLLLPEIFLELESWGISCQMLQSADKMVEIEQNYLRQLFVRAGVSKLLWAGLQLNVLHLFVPAILQSDRSIEQDDESQICNDPAIECIDRLDRNLWTGTQCFLYHF